MLAYHFGFCAFLAERLGLTQRPSPSCGTTARLNVKNGVPNHAAYL